MKAVAVVQYLNEELRDIRCRYFYDTLYNSFIPPWLHHAGEIISENQRFPKFIMWQLIVLENKRLKQWGIIKGELCALPLDREAAGPLQPASMKGKEFPIGRWGIPVRKLTSSLP
ncbi:MAG: hypothetical protein A3F41_04810 [Coxiella sp. RIFCSPHIGHO2_12_FULL_44_14]|nr:MAG: hypothetical protein A3F41_04810 [Coxiella sp. RIFCSPHIGHO2_12_FULL_44_14]